MKVSTIRKKNRRLLELLKTAADQSSDALMIAATKNDLSHPKIVYVNKAFGDLTGYRVDEVIGKEATFLQGPNTDQATLRRCIEVLATGQPFVGTFINYRKDGSEFNMEWSITPVKNDSTSQPTFICLLRDVTQRMELEKEKEELIGIISHEIKNPLTVIQGFMVLFKSHLKNRSKAKQLDYYLTSADSEIFRINSLLNDLLDATKARLKGINIYRDFCDFDEIISGIVKNMQQNSLQKIHRRGKIGELVYCDSNRIKQVITNLLSNAVKYSPESSQINIRVSKNPHQITFSIQDFGVGVPEDKQEIIFQRYYRANSRDKLEASSSGLGLYIASEIVRAHGGSIWVRSKPNEGSTFYFTLPILKPKMEEINYNQIQNSLVGE